MSAFGPGALMAAALILIAPLTISAALADGGQGGHPSGGSPDGRGGSGFTGNDGENSFPDGAGRGGGGAGGGNGGIGDFFDDNAPRVNGGTMIFSGDNTYTGGTVICSCSTLVLGDGGSSGSVIGDIANGACCPSTVPTIMFSQERSPTTPSIRALSCKSAAARQF
jgi:hypothetical protein